MIAHGDYRIVLQSVNADLIFTSPPYNIGSKSERKDGLRKHGKYDPKSFGAIRDYPDTLPETEYQCQQIEFFLWAADHLKPSGVLVYNHKPRRRHKRMIHPAEWFLVPSVRSRLLLMEEIIWDRGSTHNHGKGLMWPQTERLYVFRHHSSGDNYQLRNTSRLPQRSDIWKIDRAKRNGHNCPFPETLAEAVILAWSPVGGVVCDPYAGSGTTGIVARALGRTFVGAEALPMYQERFAKTSRLVSFMERVQ